MGEEGEGVGCTVTVATRRTVVITLELTRSRNSWYCTDQPCLTEQDVSRGKGPQRRPAA